MDVNPIELQQYLKGANYPATKDELVDLAEENDAPDDILDALRGADGDSFDGPDEVEEALA